MKSLLLLSLGHFFVDLYSGALGALQPWLVERHRLSLTQAGILGGLLVFSSSVMQPVYGVISDRLRKPVFVALGPLVAAVFISALGLAPGFWALLTMVCLGGAGIAAFHPEGSAMAAAHLEGSRGRMMAIFISAGTLGFGLGPTYFSSVVSAFGLERTWLAAVPGVAASLLLAFALRGTLPNPRSPAGRGQWRTLASVWRPLAILYALVFLRSIVQITYAQLLPLYLYRERGYSAKVASYTLTAYLLFGALGGFVGGHLADRLGGRRVILLSMAGAAPPLALFFLADGALALAGLVLGGLILLFTVPVNVIMAQELVPSQAGTVSALMMGFAWGVAGLIFIPVTGILADRFSMHAALAAWTAFPLLGFLLALRLPK
ncbi:MAG: MFS transporter [Bryobacterales bacterium]|nr:MFS transporter [Bryobacteraceae bacterium]MDW8130806.1 MFS transporter [Bryobacterales bacterium]